MFNSSSLDDKTLNFSGIFSNGDDGDNSSPTSMGSSSQTLPLFHSSNSNGSNMNGANANKNNANAGGPMMIGGADFGFANIKAGLEAQMPQQILGMNYQQRFKIFCALLILSGVFFILAFTVGLSTITLRPQKFALSFTLGSLTFMGSFSILRGPIPHLSGMVQPNRLPFTFLYLLSMMMTLKFTFNAGGPKGYVLVLGSSAMQLLALLWYLVTFLPGGAQGMKYLTTVIVAMIRPVVTGCTKCVGSCIVRIMGRMAS